MDLISQRWYNYTNWLLRVSQPGQLIWVRYNATLNIKAFDLEVIQTRVTDPNPFGSTSFWRIRSYRSNYYVFISKCLLQQNEYLHWKTQIRVTVICFSYFDFSIWIIFGCRVQIRNWSKRMRTQFILNVQIYINFFQCWNVDSNTLIIC